MSLESGTYVSDLISSNPTTTDLQSQGDDHIRLIKTLLQATFPNAGKAYRFQNDVAAKIANYTVVFPDDGNRIIPADASSAGFTVTLPTPTGVNANGWSFTVIKTDSSANVVTVAGTINGATNFSIRRQWQAVTFIYLANAAIWIAIDGQAEFSSGVTMMFRSASAPPGWTKNTSFNEHAVRITTGTPTNGGSTNFTSVFASRTIAQANLPSYTLPNSLGASSSASVGGGTLGATGTSSWGSDGGGVNGGINFSSIVVSVSTTITGSVTSGGSGSAMDFAVKYVDFIIAAKD